jgi:hypothetical protein
VIKRNGQVTVEYWTKEDKSDSIKEDFALLNDERLKERYMVRSGQRQFELIEVKNEKKK